ncbi:MAG: AmmeMemoRadiSam system protein B [Candidatus Omnitrophota bacterium]
MKKRIVIFFLVLLILAPWNAAHAKHADLAGTWYTANAKALKAELESYLASAEAEKIDGDVIGLIVPHAGFRYSGAIAAYAYKAAMMQKPDKVIIVGFSHRKYFPVISVFTDEAFVTPLGRAVVDQDISLKLIAASDRIQSIPKAFDDENSIEMEIPFAQVAFKNARIVLVAIGDQDQDNGRILADALYNVLRNEENYVIIASTDMCHFRPYDETNKRDKETIKIIEKFDPDAFYLASLKKRHELMCGPGAVYAVMLASKKLGADKVKILKYANSGDVTGEKNRVVGYLSAAFVRSKTGTKSTAKDKGGDMFNREQKDKLLKMARDTITHYLRTGERLEVESDEAFMDQMGAFVTLHKEGQLRGCIGHIVGSQPFYLTVRDMAIASATEDPRFPPVRLEELDEIDLEISALSPLKKVDDYNEIEIPGHGVMVRQGARGGVYLPQVATETGWDRDEFMNSLCAQKAGIPMDAWKTGECDIYVFTAEVFGEKERENE